MTSLQLLLALMINSLTANISVNDPHVGPHHNHVPESKQRQCLSPEPDTSTAHIHQPRTESQGPCGKGSMSVSLRLLLVVSGLYLLTKMVFGPFPGGWS